jgi:hypothetical protein
MCAAKPISASRQPQQRAQLLLRAAVQFAAAACQDFSIMDDLDVCSETERRI